MSSKALALTFWPQPHPQPRSQNVDLSLSLEGLASVWSIFSMFNFTGKNVSWLLLLADGCMPIITIFIQNEVKTHKNLPYFT